MTEAPMVTLEVVEKSPLNGDNMAKIKSLFFDNNMEYRENLENLHKTLRGLRDIMGCQAGTKGGHFSAI